MRLYLWLGAALATLALIIGAFFYGVSTGKARERVAVQKQIDRAAKAARKAADDAQVIQERAAAQDVQRQTIVREIVREVPKIVDRPVYRNVCVDADGVGLLRRSVAAANGAVGASASGPDGDAGPVR